MPNTDRTRKTNKTDTARQNPSPPSHKSHPITSANRNGFIPAYGGYENLLSFQKARIIFDGTATFCDRFIDCRSRTRDQMIQSARSGKQNILEGGVVRSPAGA